MAELLSQSGNTNPGLCICVAAAYWSLLLLLKHFGRWHQCLLLMTSAWTMHMQDIFPRIDAKDIVTAITWLAHAGTCNSRPFNLAA